MTPDAPIVKELLFIGGGHAHALVLRRWGMRPVPGVRLTLVNPGATAPYTGMLPGHVAGHYGRDALEMDLVQLARFAGARFVEGRAVALDRAARRVTLASGRSLAYDLLSLDIGITSEMPSLPGFAAHGVAAKPLGRFADLWSAVTAGEGAISVAVLGGGVAGAELAMAVAHRLDAIGRPREVALIDRGAILSRVAPAARRHIMAALSRWRVVLVENDMPVEVTAQEVILQSGRRVAADLTIGAAGAVPQPWVAETGLETLDGYVVTDRYLRSVTDPAVYAVGDCAHFAPDPRPKAGVYAVRAAPVLAQNLAADLTGRQRRPFRPQRDFLKLISLGGKRAVAEKGGLAFEGALAWRWKDRIDARFMERFRDLPEMQAPPVPKNAAQGVAAELAGPAPCGGCGAKLGSGALAGVISGLPGAVREDAEQLPGDDAAVLSFGTARQVISTDHLRAFALDPALVARVAAVHALGDVWAMGATPQSALATVILPRMAARLQGRWLDEVMGAAAEVFAAEGAAVLGGHSSMGLELTVGFAVTGLLDGPPVTLAGAEPGDALLLTKALGSGVILAAEMRGKARGADVLACWEAMSRPQGDAARLLAPVAHAMTDVTGFGLAGHLWNICGASGVGAEVALGDLPVLSGAETLAARGIRSTLYGQNRAALEHVAEAPGTPRGDLVFDPQTAGGLLASVPDAEAAALVNRLRDAGFPAARVGTVTDTPARIVFT
ncbi:selenide, water dikinase SelD [Roseibacterium sp. SDUM158016]|uniref:selenide, water dikinase SelD n=1 Tax=Roseicyclus sediminis TaxID=2980997 RepID=UPI0021D02D11|nr:selenide, water dikinase SelD [Roseibacterium sp. SDUM158016]MCU4653205.1 selenide, water dikinase SelD [Roseibacterium sp. SDUM158016]